MRTRSPLSIHPFVQGDESFDIPCKRSMIQDKLHSLFGRLPFLCLSRQAADAFLLITGKSTPVRASYECSIVQGVYKTTRHKLTPLIREAIMNKELTARLLGETAALGIIRIQFAERLIGAVDALRCGGLCYLEITMTTPGALRAIEQVSEKLEEVVIGAGTVLDAPTARQAILAGAEFLVTPTVEFDVIETAHRYGKVVIVGAMTPTEILTAWEAGADMVKVFPADILGPGYLKAVHGPLPQIPLVPTGGITAENAGDFIHAGAALVCAGGWLVDKKAVAEGRYGVLTERARQLVAAVQEAKEEMT